MPLVDELGEIGPAGADDAAGPWWRLPVGWAAMILVGVGAVVYLNSFRGQFLLDDYSAIVTNRRVHKLWPVWETMFGSKDMRPVVALTFAVNYRLGGLEVWGYHAFNLAVHLLAALALFGVVRRTLLAGRGGRELASAADPLALAVALIWMAHPLQTQAVTYVVQRAESMMGMLYLLTLYCVIRGAGSPRPRRWYAAAVAACAAGMGCKQVMVTAPVVVLLYDRVFLARGWGRLLRRRWGLYVGLVLTWLILLRLGASVPRAAKAGFQFAAISPGEYARTQFGVIMHYLRLTFWPRGLCLDYGWPVARTAGEIVVPAIKVGLLVAATAVALWRWPPAGFLGAWFFLILAPTSSFMPIADPAFEHRMYLPLAAVAAAAVTVAYALGASFLGRGVREPEWRSVLGQTLGFALLVGVVAALGFLTVRRNADYADAVRMYADVVDRCPRNPRARVNLGLSLENRGRGGDVAEAKRHYQFALGLMPDYPDALNNLGKILAEEEKDPAAAEKLFRRALQIKPNHRLARLNLAMALEQQGKTREAIGQFAEAVRIDPEWFSAYNNLGILHARHGSLPEAVRCYREAIRLSPQWRDPRLNLALALARQGQFAEAEAAYEELIRMHPGCAAAHFHLGQLVARQGEHKAAAGHFARALRLQPDHRGARAALRRVENLRVVFAERVDSCRGRLRAKPEDAQAMDELARLLATCADESIRDGPAAVALATRACRASGNKDPARLATLAAAYAEVGRFREAAATARRAVQAALQADQPDLASQIERHVELYDAGRPLRKTWRW